MTEGTSQGLFIVIAIIIFGIFVGLAYTAFGDVLQPKMVHLFEEALDFKLDKEVTPDVPAEIEEYVVFEDYILEIEVKRILGIKGYNEKVSISSMKDLKNIESGVFSSLEGLEHATNLESLNLSSGQEFSDLTPISNLTKLKELTLTYTKVKDISKLKNLKNLEKLDLTSTNFDGDFSFLADLTSLKELNLSQNNITAITDISKLTKLEKLTLSYNQITNISILTNLTNLKHLDLSNQWNNTTYKTISDIKPLYTLSSLEYLNLKTNVSIPESQIKYMQENSPKLTTFIQP